METKARFVLVREGHAPRTATIVFRPLPPNAQDDRGPCQSASGLAATERVYGTTCDRYHWTPCTAASVLLQPWSWLTQWVIGRVVYVNSKQVAIFPSFLRVCNFYLATHVGMTVFIIGGNENHGSAHHRGLVCHHKDSQCAHWHELQSSKCADNPLGKNRSYYCNQLLYSALLPPSARATIDQTCPDTLVE